LNKLHDTFEKRGLTIVGVTGEPEALIRKFVEDKGIRYVIAIGGGGYRHPTIPHVWLVSPKGSVILEGMPSQLTEALIEEHLKTVQLWPAPKLPKSLNKVEKSLKAGAFGSAIKDLESYLKKPKSEEEGAEAKKALEEVKKYGSNKLDEAEALAKEREYVFALETLAELEKGFKGNEVGDTAKKRTADLKKDKAVQTELEAQKLLAKAEDLLKEKKYKPAAKYLKGIVGQKKYADTKAKEKAEKKLDTIKGYL
jgi:hypothetical protein